METPLRAGVLITPFIGLILVFLAGIFGLAPGMMRTIDSLSAWISQGFGWAFVSVGVIALITLLLSMIRLSHVCIGGPELHSPHSGFTAIAIGLAASTSLGLLFWATAEPLYHVHQAPLSFGIQPLSLDAQLFARAAAYLHWAIIVFGMNALSLLVFSLGTQNAGKRPTISDAIFRSPQTRAIGSIFDALLVFFATFMAVGALASCILVLSGEMTRFGSSTGPNTAALFSIAAALIFIIFIAGARPIGTTYAMMARICLVLMLVLMLAAFVLGPSLEIIINGFSAFGKMVLYFPKIITFAGGTTAESGPQTWTVNHWGYAMMISPLVGLFLSRAARGFSVGRAMALFIFAPAVITFFWVMIFSGLAISLDRETGGGLWAAINQHGADIATYRALWRLPGGDSLVVGFVILMALSFITFAAGLIHAIMRICAPGSDKDEFVGSARTMTAMIWCLGLGLAGWGLASFGVGPVADTLARLGALPALMITLGLIVALIRFCTIPEILENGVRTHKEPVSDTVHTRRKDDKIGRRKDDRPADTGQRHDRRRNNA